MVIVWKFSSVLLYAAGVTVWISWLALVLAALLGGAIGYARTARWWPVRAIATFYTELFRSIPTLVQLFFVYYGITFIFSIDLSPFVAATIGLGFEASALMSEVVRSGLQSVGKGQREAALSSGLRAWQVALYVVWPQAIRVMIPSAVGVYVSTLKASSLASVIGYVELTRASLLVRESIRGGPSGLVVICVAALMYVILCYAISFSGALIEKRFGYVH
jgi:His/Glu/Gln/Arg/opine family amino acid ABC transporter permease subunit